MATTPHDGKGSRMRCGSTANPDVFAGCISKKRKKMVSKEDSKEAAFNKLLRGFVNKAMPLFNEQGTSEDRRWEQKNWLIKKKRGLF